MAPGLGRSAFLLAAVASALGAAGCGTTGLAWVHEPESGVDLTPPTGVAGASAVRTGAPAPVWVAPPREAAPTRRLDRTVTLGETTAAAPTPAAPTGERANGASPVVVNVYVQQAPTPVYYPSYGVGYGVASGGFAPVVPRVVATQPAAMRPGLDWAPPPSYGPAFPYHTAPASPWHGDGGARRPSIRR